MSIEEAEYILNEAVISEPSINSYTYISAEEINKAIEKMLEERLKNERKIKQLEECIIKERNILEDIIRKKELEKNKYPVDTHTNKNTYLTKLIKCVKKVVKPLFLLEN